MLMKFYTTEEQERRLQEVYSRNLVIKQAEIDERARATGRIQKYTAYAHVLRESRVFIVEDGVIYFGAVGEAHKCPDGSVSGGRVYRCDERYADAICEFVKRNSNYTVVFKPDGRYGPTVSYCGPGIPAYFTGINDELVADDEDNYDICCL